MKVNRKIAQLQTLMNQLNEEKCTLGCLLTKQSVAHECVFVFETPLARQIPEVVFCACNLTSKKTARKSGAHWTASLAGPINSRSWERPCLKECQTAIKKTPLPCTHTHTPTHTERSTWQVSTSNDLIEVMKR